MSSDQGWAEGASSAAYVSRTLRLWGRPSFYDLWRDLRAATAEIRPDWDLATPGLREAWEAGDYSPFHGWDRRPAGSMSISA